VSADRVQVVSNGKTIADHRRRFERDKTYYEPWHYLEALALQRNLET